MQKIILAAGVTQPYLIEVAAVIAAAAIVAYLSYRMGIVPIVGFLLAGVLIGPHALQLVTDFELIDATAEVGVILLLFTIGIEFSLEKLAKIKNLIFIGGGVQVISATALTAVILFLFGVDWKIGIFGGFLIALSSTAIVLKLLGDKGETNSTPGQVSLGLLIFQDLAVIIMVLLVPILAGGEGNTSDIFIALGKAVGIILFVLLLARRIMPKILEAVAKTCSPELFLLSIIAICFGTAYLTSLAGVSVSLGAFLAGLIVSESRFSQHAFNEILPLQILFSATFFVSVGMLLDVGFLLSNFLMIFAIVIGVLIVKIITTGISIKALGYRMPVVIAGSLVLAQIGEFSFVLEKAGREIGLTPAGMGEIGSQVFIASTVILMVASPLLAQLGIKISNRVAVKETKMMTDKMETNLTEEVHPNIQNHIIIAGYGDTAKKIIKIISGTGIPYIITTLSPVSADEAERDGFPVIRGDASKLNTLQYAGIGNAKMLLIADDDPAMVQRICSVARNFNPTLRIVVRTRYLSDVEHLLNKGADKVIPEELESVVQMLKDVLRDYNISEDEIKIHKARLRVGDYKILREESLIESSPVVCSDINSACLETRIIKIHEGMQILSKSILDIDFMSEFNLSLKKIKRDGREIFMNNGFNLQPGDELILEGSVKSFAQLIPLLRVDKPVVTQPSENSSEEMLSFREGNYLNKEITLLPNKNSRCLHVLEKRSVIQKSQGCEECLKIGDSWVHLRICMTCGHVGCCDSSKNKHATRHFHAKSHPVVRSLEPGENWAWCYIDEIVLLGNEK
jgi:CPA2 family monovalent cation:H+ antiporter-2